MFPVVSESNIIYSYVAEEGTFTVCEKSNKTWRNSGTILLSCYNRGKRGNNSKTQLQIATAHFFRMISSGRPVLLKRSGLLPKSLMPGKIQQINNCHLAKKDFPFLHLLKLCTFIPYHATVSSIACYCLIQLLLLLLCRVTEITDSLCGFSHFLKYLELSKLPDISVSLILFSAEILSCHTRPRAQKKTNPRHFSFQMCSNGKEQLQEKGIYLKIGAFENSSINFKIGPTHTQYLKPSKRNR